MTEAIFGLVGVIVGAVAATGGEFLLVRRREGAAAKQAARLIHAELLECVSTVAGAVTDEVPFPSGVEDRLPVGAWEQYGPAISGAVGGEAWMEIHTAYVAIQLLNRAAAMNSHDRRRKRDPAIRNSEWLEECASDIITAMDAISEVADLPNGDSGDSEESIGLRPPAPPSDN